MMTTTMMMIIMMMMVMMMMMMMVVVISIYKTQIYPARGCSKHIVKTYSQSKHLSIEQ